MIASLGMYDRTEIAAANDALWSLIRDGLRKRGLTAPEALTRGAQAYWPAWAAPDLLLSQTCGLPFRARLHDTVTLVGTPDYGVAGCAPGYYRSVLIARLDDPRTTESAFSATQLAINEPLSQSGWAAVYQHFHDLGLAIGPVIATGGHRASALAVAEGRADFAAIDAVTWELLTRHEAFASGLRVFAQTRATPGLPLITALAGQADAVFAAVSQAIDDLGASQRHTLCLRGLTRIPASAYLALPIPPAPAQFGGTL
ncbi:MAG: PhnD/SsuA/transferrin family substrate-binding protein [Pseudotabrizicola sp.]|uniref:phosphate/phosphite/phosphonate ABC transporter substrate-binding protein n=1 Tax=Pseudotabrizicola sp. TaxID=2939647 RepID=UPI0027272012|nr:PhnD/SsuA/transferrin family substrate-binding protein [Pseudotabrizicola sp.]MDO8881638.1 PhnD/SsuA/transferrin family substrate-binding protein [Pseudotabrizicola sp.]MDP2080858.1 PhnD/SsuA/transferrin family substrate-binding protein [Pseudotabrizicola sp.]MDZ7572740.1 PhnD/SsuA/transferrin family substrate-binding protein [Pseudotabrizicola sp.]